MRWPEPRPGSRAEPGIMKAFPPLANVEGNGVRSRRPHAGVAARNDRRGRRQVACGAHAAEGRTHGEHARGERREAALIRRAAAGGAAPRTTGRTAARGTAARGTTASDLAEGRFPVHKSSSSKKSIELF